MPVKSLVVFFFLLHSSAEGLGGKLLLLVEVQKVMNHAKLGFGVLLI